MKKVKTTNDWASRNGIGVNIAPNGKNTKSTTGWNLIKNNNPFSINTSNSKTANTGATKSIGIPTSSNSTGKEIVIKYIKEIGKSALDALGEAGTYGKESCIWLV